MSEMAKGPSKKKQAEAAASLAGLETMQAAIKFLEPATVEHAVIVIRNGYATIFDGLIAIGIQVQGFNFNCNADFDMLKGALSKCKTTPTLEYVEAAHRIKVTAGKLTAYVRCTPLAEAEMALPTMPMVQIDGDAFVKTLDIVGKVAVEKAARLVESTVYVRTGSACATNGQVIWEHWHGQSLPDMSMPKHTVKILTGVKKKMTQFACAMDGSNNVVSATFWYEDGSFIRSQLYVEPRPDVDQYLEAKAQLFPVPEGLWEALDAIEPMLDDTGTVILAGKEVRTSDADNEGARYTIAGALPQRLMLNHEYLMMVAPFATMVDWIASSKTVRFGGDYFRAIVAIVHDKKEKPAPAPAPAIPPPAPEVAQPSYQFSSTTAYVDIDEE